MGHQIAKYPWNFKKLDSFDIGKVRPIRIRRRILCDFRRFWAIFGDFRKITKNRPRFFWKTRLKSPRIADFRKSDDEFQLARLCQYQN